MRKSKSFLLGLVLCLLLLPVFGQSLPDEPDYPIYPKVEPTPAGAPRIERLKNNLRAWMTWWDQSWTPWNEADQKWHKEVKALWTKLADSLKKSNEEKTALRLENDSLRARIKQLEAERWIWAGGGFLAGGGIAVGISLLSK
jgi:hypothetical protein